MSVALVKGSNSEFETRSNIVASSHERFIYPILAGVAVVSILLIASGGAGAAEGFTGIKPKAIPVPTPPLTTQEGNPYSIWKFPHGENFELSFRSTQLDPNRIIAVEAYSEGACGTGADDGSGGVEYTFSPDGDGLSLLNFIKEFNSIKSNRVKISEYYVFSYGEEFAAVMGVTSDGKTIKFWQDQRNGSIDPSQIDQSAINRSNNPNSCPSYSNP